MLKTFQLLHVQMTFNFRVGKLMQCAPNITALVSVENLPR